MSKLILPLLATCICAAGADMTVEKDGSILRFTAAGKAVCSYQMEAGEVPPGVDPVFRHGAHLHPLFTPSGRLVTGNHQPDHPWQRGVWMAWTKTEFGTAHPDFWNMGKVGQKLEAEVRFERLEKSWASGQSGGFTSRHVFLDHSSTPDRRVLEEVWEVTLAQASLEGKLANVIDLVSTQTCASDLPLKLPQYHYGGLGVRGNPAWNAVDAVTMLTSEGHDRKAGDATKAKWVHLGGMVDGAPAGLAVLIHPQNFRFPQPLRLNPKNPQLCIAPSQDGDWAIEPGKPLVSKYRLLAYDGEADAGWLEARWQDYAAGR